MPRQSVRKTSLFRICDIFVAVTLVTWLKRHLKMKSSRAKECKTTVIHFRERKFQTTFTSSYCTCLSSILSIAIHGESTIPIAEEFTNEMPRLGHG